MAILFGVLLLVGGFAVLAWRPWLDPDPRPVSGPAGGAGQVRRGRPAPARKLHRGTTAPHHVQGEAKPRPRPSAGFRHQAVPHQQRLERIPRGRRVPPEPGRDEIVLPEWLGPVS